MLVEVKEFTHYQTTRVAVGNGKLESFLFNSHSKYFFFQYQNLWKMCLLVTLVILKRIMVPISQQHPGKNH